MTCKNKCRSTTVLEEILLDLHHTLARLAWLIQEYLFFSKKVIRADTENSVGVGLFIASLIHSFSFFLFKVIADQLFYSCKFYLYQDVYAYVYFLKKRRTMLYEDFKVICKVMCSLVKQKVVC